MATKNEVIKSIFGAFPKLNTFWVDGDLETFQNTVIITEDGFECDVLLFLSDKYDALEVECGLMVISETDASDANLKFKQSFEEIKRSDYM